MKPWKRSWRLARSSLKRWSRSSGNSSCWRSVLTLPLASVEPAISSWRMSQLLSESPRGGVESLDLKYCALQHELQGHDAIYRLIITICWLPRACRAQPSEYQLGLGHHGDKLAVFGLQPCLPDLGAPSP